jgi:hypothetical protein
MKNKAHKKYLLLSIVLSLSVFGAYIFLKYIIDTANIYNHNSKLIKNESLYSRTQKFTEINRIKPNTIILGGSRVQFLSPKDIKKYTKDKVYNLAFNFSTLQEQYHFLKYSIVKSS